MNFDRKLIDVVLSAEDSVPLSKLIDLGKLEPAMDFQNRDLTELDFGDLDVSGYNFTGSDFTGSDLTRVRNASKAKWKEAVGCSDLGALSGATEVQIFRLDAIQFEVSKDAKVSVQHIRNRNFVVHEVIKENIIVDVEPDELRDSELYIRVRAQEYTTVYIFEIRVNGEPITTSVLKKSTLARRPSRGELSGPRELQQLYEAHSFKAGILAELASSTKDRGGYEVGFIQLSVFAAIRSEDSSGNFYVESLGDPSEDFGLFDPEVHNTEFPPYPMRLLKLAEFRWNTESSPKSVEFHSSVVRGNYR